MSKFITYLINLLRKKLEKYIQLILEEQKKESLPLIPLELEAVQKEEKPLPDVPDVPDVSLEFIINEVKPKKRGKIRKFLGL